MKQFWMLYKTGLKQVWYVPVLIAAVFGASILNEYYRRTTPFYTSTWVFDYMFVMALIIAPVASLLLLYLFRDDWNSKRICHLHSLPVSRSVIFLSRLSVIYTVIVFAFLMNAFSEYLSHMKDPAHLALWASQTSGVYLSSFLLIGAVSIYAAIFYSIHRFRQTFGFVFIVGIVALPYFMKINFDDVAIDVFLAVLYHVIALVVYEKYAEV